MYNNYCKCNCKTNAVSCTYGIRESLKVVVECVNKTGNIPGFGVNILITLKSGETQDILVSPSTLTSIVILEDTVVYGKVTISLCEVSKIKILTSTVTNQEFINCLVRNLQNISMKTCGCNNACDYYALTIDDGYGMMRGYNANCNCYCTTCKAKTQEQCSCTEAMKNQLCVNKDNIESIGFNGNTESINAIEKIDKENVLKDILLNKESVVENVTIDTNSVSSLDLINTREVSVVENIILSQTSIVTDINILPDTVVKDVVYKPIDIVTDIDVENKNIVSGIQTSTALIQGIAGVNPVQFISTIGGEVTEVVTGINTDTNVFVTGYENPVMINVLDSSEAEEISTIPISIPLFTLPVGTTGPLQVVIPAASIDGVNPVAPVTLPVQVGGVNVVISDVETFELLDSQAVLASYPFGLNQTEAIYDLGTPESEEAIIAVGADTTFISHITTGTTGTINSISPAQPTTVFTDFRTIQDSVSGVTFITKEPIDQITSTIYTTVVRGINYSSDDISNIINESDVIINDVDSINPVDLLTEATANMDKIDVVESVEREISSVVKNIDTVEVKIPSTNQSPIEGKVLYVGCGIVVISENTGNISIYSLCEINSFTTK
ncbi:MAG: hypothetical protein ACRCXT_03385 [Paraclostridium sp.]